MVGKKRFPCLTNELRLSLSTCMNVITACALLWNFIIDSTDATQNDIYDDTEENLNEGLLNDEFISNQIDTSDGRRVRNSVIQRYF